MLHRPLLVTDDDVVLDQLLAVTSAAAVDPVVARDAVAAATSWAEASAVLVDARVAESCVRTGLARRDGVVVVVPPEADDPGVWPLAVRLGAQEVICLPDRGGWLGSWLADVGVETGWAPVVAVAGSCGGAGASTLAAALAVTAVQDHSDTVLVDADPWGGGLDLLVGAEVSPGIRWSDLAVTAGRVSRSSVVPALPLVDGLPVLAFGRGDASPVDVSVFTSVLDGVARGGDLVVVDVGRGSPYTEAVLARADTLLVVATPRLRAVASAARLLAGTAAEQDVRLLVRVEGRGGLDPLDVAESLQLSLAGLVPRDPRRTEHEELGVAPAAGRRSGLARLCRSLLVDVPAGRAA